MASSAEQYQHPLPSPPQHVQQQPMHYNQPSHPQDDRPVKSRAFSFHSDKSRRSSLAKQHLHETHDEKEARRLHSKADPTLAISEAEPSAIAAMRSQSAYAPLRAIQHKDPLGNPIGDPDLSNPTRNRWERPLDTIRSFEAAIDGGYVRKSMIRTDTDPIANWNRRTSYHPAAQPRFPQDSYYGNRPTSQFGMPNPGAARNGSYGGQGYNNGANDGGYGQPAPRQRAPRMQSEPHYQVYSRDQTVYPLPNKDRSYETVTSAGVSGNSDPAGYQTDPTSSDNSSIERRSPAKRQDPVNDYGIGFSQSQTYQTPNFSFGNNGNNVMNHPLPPPPMEAVQQQPPRHTIPRKQPSLLKRQPVPVRPEPEKRKSWLARRFSKNP